MKDKELDQMLKKPLLRILEMMKQKSNLKWGIIQ